MTKQERQAITEYIAINRGNCGDSKAFWSGLFALINGMVEIIPSGYKINLTSNGFPGDDEISKTNN